jgi:putative Holliday junction resolvase
MPVQAEDIIALDVGAIRTGIARASSKARLAEPLKTIPTEDVIDELRKLAHEHRISSIVVGLPRSLESQDTPQTEYVRHFVENARTELPGLDFFLQDEALTTVAAETAHKSKVTDIDAAAASIILQDFLDSEARA